MTLLTTGPSETSPEQVRPGGVLNCPDVSCTLGAAASFRHLTAATRVAPPCSASAGAWQEGNGPVVYQISSGILFCAPAPDERLEGQMFPRTYAGNISARGFI